MLGKHKSVMYLEQQLEIKIGGRFRSEQFATFPARSLSDIRLAFNNFQLQH